MILFGGERLSTVTFEVLKAELADKAEGFFLDYKEDFPKRLEKYIASFANGHGGYIFIGVQEDASTKLPAAYPGVDSASDPAEKVRNIARSGVSPFPPMEIAAIPLPDAAGRCVVAVRIPEGVTPPYICHDGKIYLRNLDASDPADPIKDRFSLDRLYDKAANRERRLEARLAETITYSRIYPSKQWEKSHGNERIVFAAVFYADSGIASAQTLSRDEMQSAVLAVKMGGNFRSLRNGLALVSAHDQKIINEWHWWTADRLVAVYGDGILETVEWCNRNEMRPLSAHQIASDVYELGLEHLGRLQAADGFVGDLVAEIHILGVWGFPFSDQHQKVSKKCDHGIVKLTTKIQPVPPGEKPEQVRLAFILRIIAELMDEAGGRVHP